MTIQLYPALKDAASARKWSNVPRILRFVFETGVVTTVLTVVITGLLFSKAPSTQYLGYIFYYHSGVLYCSWLLASLSARTSAAQKTAPAMNVTGSKAAIPGEIRFRANTTQGARDELTLTILTTVEEDVDEEESSAEPTTKGCICSTFHLKQPVSDYFERTTRSLVRAVNPRRCFGIEGPGG